MAVPAMELRICKDSGYAVLKIRRFFKDDFDEPAEAYPQLLRDAFRDVAAAGVRSLIVDLRGNGGGLGINAGHLVQYLSDSTFSPTRSITFRGKDEYYRAFTADSLGLDEYFGLRPPAGGLP